MYDRAAFAMSKKRDFVPRTPVAGGGSESAVCRSGKATVPVNPRIEASGRDRLSTSANNARAFICVASDLKGGPPLEKVGPTRWPESREDLTFNAEGVIDETIHQTVGILHGFHARGRRLCDDGIGTGQHRSFRPAIHRRESRTGVRSILVSRPERRKSSRGRYGRSSRVSGPADVRHGGDVTTDRCRGCLKSRRYRRFNP